MGSSNTVIVPSSGLGNQPWWNEVHALIMAAYRVKDTQVFPPSWSRLNADPAIAASKFANEELGPQGHLVVVFDDEKPIACGGVLPFRGKNWINNIEEDIVNKVTVKNGDLVPPPPKEAPSMASNGSPVADWEVCCFCVSHSHRGEGLSSLVVDTLLAFIKPRGAKRLVTNYSIEETGKFWPKMGFATIPGAGGMLKKGFTHTAGMEGLRADVHFAMGERAVV